jgi:Zn-dependent protease
VTADGSGAVPVRVCDACGGQMPAAFLACPGCGRLLHAQALKSLAADAAQAEKEGRADQALAAWRKVLELLPPGSGQHQQVLASIQSLSAAVSRSAAPPGAGGSAATAPADGQRRSPRNKVIAGLGAVGVLLAKFKWALLFLLGKGKLLLVGLFKAKTFLSGAIAIGVYSMIYGWRFAVGLVLSLYVHEMGHVAALRRYGIAATAPMFIPGVGAFVRLNQRPATAGEDARVGLAGPIWGAAAAVAALMAGHLLHSPLLAAVARIGALINIFNLLPVWQLDGGRGFAPLSRGERGFIAAVLWLLALSGADGVFWLLAIAATVRAGGRETTVGEPRPGDRPVAATYVALAVGLTVVMALAKGSA